MKTAAVKLLALAALWLPMAASGAEIRIFELEKRDDLYLARAETFVEAPPALVLSVLLDYRHFHRLSDSLTASYWLPGLHDGAPLAYSRLDSCVAFFCRKLEKVEKVIVHSDREIVTEALPERSDFLVNRTHWQLQPEGTGTRVSYRLEMRPDFWVPPLIGTWAIRRKAFDSAGEIAERIEYLAATGTPLAEFDLAAYRKRGG